MAGLNRGGEPDCSVLVVRGMGACVAGVGALLAQATNNAIPTASIAVKDRMGLCIHINYQVFAPLHVGYPEKAGAALVLLG